jgi:cytochrome c-type biogenesis protein
MLEIAGVNALLAFAAGVISFLSPCVLPLVPGYVSYVAGISLDDLREPGNRQTRLIAVGYSSAFVLGFTLVFVILGASATALGQLFLSYRSVSDVVAGGIIVLFGIHLSGVLRLPALNRDARFAVVRGRWKAPGAVLLGAAFAFGWTPCIGPILGSVLTLGAARGTATEGASLLFVYALGLGIPFLLVAFFTGWFLRRLKAVGRIGRQLQIGSGMILVLVGLAMAFGYLGVAATWLLTNLDWLRVLVV